MYTDVIGMAAQYVNSAQSYYRSAVQFALMRESLDGQDYRMKNLIEAMKRPVSYEPHLGKYFDAYA